MGHPVTSNPHPPAPRRVSKGQHEARCRGGDRRQARLKTPPHGPMLHSEHRGVDGMVFLSARGEIPEATDVPVAGLSGIRS